MRGCFDAGREGSAGEGAPPFASVEDGEGRFCGSSERMVSPNFLQQAVMSSLRGRVCSRRGGGRRKSLQQRAGESTWTRWPSASWIELFDAFRAVQGVVVEVNRRLRTASRPLHLLCTLALAHHALPGSDSREWQLQPLPGARRTRCPFFPWPDRPLDAVLARWRKYGLDTAQPSDERMFWLDEEEEQGSAAQQGSKRGREDEGADGPCRNRSKQQQEVVRIETGRSTRENGVTQSEAATCSAVATDAPPKTPRARTKSSSSPVAERHKRIGHFFDLPAEETAETAPSRSSDSQSRQAETAQTTPTRPSTPAKSRSRGPRQAQTRTASLSKNFNEDLPDVLSRSAVFPPVAGLFFNHYQPYLVDEPVEADFSSLLSDEFVRFACAVAPPEKWSAKPDRLQDNELAVPGLGRFIGMWQPNKAAIVAAAPLHRSRAYRSITSDLLPKFEAMTVVMQWIWENEEIGLPEVAGMVQTAPLPVYILSALSLSRPCLLAPLITLALPQSVPTHPTPATLASATWPSPTSTRTCATSAPAPSSTPRPSTYLPGSTNPPLALRASRGCGGSFADGMGSERAREGGRSGLKARRRGRGGRGRIWSGGKGRNRKGCEGTFWQRAKL